MTTQIEHAKLLHDLHVAGDPLILFNVWDAGSAIAMQDVGAKVIATGSWSVAAAHGFDDGEQCPFDLVIDNLKRIIAGVDRPVTFDFESGYGEAPEEVKNKVIEVIESGVAGINFEDQIIGSNTLYSIENQCKRIKAIRETADHTAIPIFINARTDIFLQNDSKIHNEGHVEEAISRAIAYTQSGANGFFAPGLTNLNLIKKLCDHSPIPVNIMVSVNEPAHTQLAKLGVARISYGPNPYCLVMEALKNAGEKVYLAHHLEMD